jgi:hypothetical protein
LVGSSTAGARARSRRAVEIDEQQSDTENPVDDLGQTLAFDAAVACVHAGRAWIADPEDNALGAARQLVESLFAAYSSFPDGANNLLAISKEFLSSRLLSTEVTRQRETLANAVKAGRKVSHLRRSKSVPRWCRFAAGFLRSEP